MNYRSLIGILILLVAAIPLSLFTYWYLEAVLSALVGMVAFRRRKDALLASGAAVLGLIISILAVNAPYRLKEASLFSAIAGIPGGYAFPLLLTIIIFALITYFASILGVDIAASGGGDRKGSDGGLKESAVGRDDLDGGQHMQQ